MAETASQVNINDIPENLRPFRDALVKAAFGLVFTPEYLEQQGAGTISPLSGAQGQFPVANGTGNRNAPPPATPPPVTTIPLTIDQRAAAARQPDEILSPVRVAGPRVRGGLASILNTDTSSNTANNTAPRRRKSGGTIRKATGGGIEFKNILQAAADAVEKSYGGDVMLTGGGSPLGGQYQPITYPNAYVPTSISTGVGAAAPGAPVNVVSPYINRGSSGYTGGGQQQYSGGGIGGQYGQMPPPAQGANYQFGQVPLPPTNLGPLPQNGSLPSYVSAASQGLQPSGGIKASDGFMAQTPGMPNPTWNQTFADYWANKEAGLKSGFVTRESLNSELSGWNMNDPTVQKLYGMTPAAQEAYYWAQLHPNDPGIAAAGGVDAFIAQYNKPQYAINNINPNLAGVGGGNYGGQQMQQQGSGGTPPPPSKTVINPATGEKSSSDPNNPYAWMFEKKAAHGGIIRYAEGGATDPNLGGSGGNPPPPSQYGFGWANGSPAMPSGSTYGGVFQPYQSYNNQRVLGQGNWGQFDPNQNVYTTSGLTDAALSGYANIPTAFNGSFAQYGARLFNSGNLATESADMAKNVFLQDANPVKSVAMDYINRIGQNPNMFSAGDIQLGQLTAPQLMSPMSVNPERVQTSLFDGGTAQQYMSPFMQNVVDVEKQKAIQDYQENKQYRDANAVAAGAFGGSRQGVAEGVAARELTRNLGQIQAAGQQAAFENAQQQFERDRAAGINVSGMNQNAGLQAMMANQGAGLQAGQANLNAALNTQELARNSGLAAAQANQSTRLNQNNALLQAVLGADRAAMDAAQGNSNLRLQAIDRVAQGAAGGANIAQSEADLYRLQQAMELQRLQALAQAGASVDARTQNVLDLGYQDFINQKNYPYQQLSFLQGILSGTPMGFNQESVMFQRINPWTQAAGLAAAGLGAYAANKS